MGETNQGPLECGGLPPLSKAGASSRTPKPESPSDARQLAATEFSPGSRFLRATTSVISNALDLVFPPSCVSCHGLVENDATDPATREFRNLCASCRRRIIVVSAPHCTTCGHPFFGELAENIGCSHCETLRPVFREGRTAALLQGPMRDLVLAFKYHKAMHVLHDVAALVRGHAYFLSFLAGARLVPVPLHPRKFRDRGFNQAQLLAEVFVRQAEGASIHPVLQRTVDTSTQTRLDREQRQANLKNAFALAPRVSLEPEHRYVLVDDVFTTGATLNACAAVLQRAGVTTIDVATLGHG
jgi:ComF family protein